MEEKILIIKNIPGRILILDAAAILLAIFSLLCFLWQ